ncbi:MAG: hypothetical protein ACI8P2_003172, partial [Candidatus Latescibacterota bacterium]
PSGGRSSGYFKYGQTRSRSNELATMFYSWARRTSRYQWTIVAKTFVANLNEKEDIES